MKKFLKSFAPALLAGTIILCLGVEAGIRTRGYFAVGSVLCVRRGVCLHLEREQGARGRLTQKERLIELISIASEFTVVASGMTIEEQRRMISQQIAAVLLKNGVIVPPCKVGDTVYVISPLKIVVEGRVTSIYCSRGIEKINLFYPKGKASCPVSVPFREIGTDVFFTRKEARAELKRRNNGH